MITSRYERLFLFIQDVLLLFIALWITLIVRYQEVPTMAVFAQHAGPFAWLFGVWCLVYFISGVYEKQSTLWKKRLPLRLLRAQVINSGIAVAFFYLIPYFTIAPKTILFLYILISGTLLILVRMAVVHLMVPRKKQQGLLIAGGVEKDLLVTEINGNNHYGVHFSAIIDLDTVTGQTLITKIQEQLSQNTITTVVIDLDHPQIQSIVSGVYTLFFSKVTFINFNTVYENIFDRIPLSSVTHGWFLEYVSLQPRYAYDVIKRAMDIVLSSIGFILSIPFYVLAYILIKCDDGGPLFVTQSRIGHGNQVFTMKKFRSMTTDDAGEYGTATAKTNKITRVGVFLRKSRIDELPQLLSVIKGDQSLIGPRPELPALVRIYEQQIPYYTVRHMVKPGLSGWAQVYGEHGHGQVAVEMTKEKLSYDLYYIKNRSVFLDVIIALKTIQILLSFVGK